MALYVSLHPALAAIRDIMIAIAIAPLEPLTAAPNAAETATSSACFAAAAAFPIGNGGDL